MLKIYMMILKKQWRLSSLAGIGMLFVLLLSLSEQAFSQNLKTVTGQVTEAGEPLPGVSIKVKGTTRGTTTLENGSYTLQAGSDDVLVFSMIGFKTQEITVGTRTTINVVLAGDAAALNEVIVIGYGSTAKKDLTGAVGIVNMADLTKAPVGSFTEALAGRVAGVQVAANDGQPGSFPRITIRGAGSLTQSTSPLYVIDGFAIEDPEGASLNPEDIESMTVLKDASATSVYGSRGANGVIVIETKKGKAGQSEITVNNSIGFQSVRKQMELMSPYEFVKYQLERAPADASLNYLTNGRTLDSYRDMEGIKWTDAITQTGRQNIHNLALRGGNAQTRYSLSGSIFDNNGVILNTGWGRKQGRVSLDHDISKKLKASVTANYSDIDAFGQPASSSADQGISSVIWFRTWAYRPVGSSINTLNPGQAPLEIDENNEVDLETIYNSDIRIGPVTSMMNTHHVNSSKNLNVNASLSYEIIKDLTLKVSGITQDYREQQERFYNSKTPQGSPFNVNNQRGINGSIFNRNRSNWANENILTYNKSFNTDHAVNLVGGFSMQSEKTSEAGHQSWFIETESLGMSGFDNGTPYNPVARSGENTLASYFSRLNYSYKSKYLFTGSFRGDGSSKFAPRNRWGLFYAGAVAWSMHNENFMKNIPVISNSKLRLSYGTTGNNRVDDFDYYDQLTFNVNGYAFQNSTPTAAALISTVANPDLRWETTTTTNIGYDLGLFKNRIELSVEWYKKITSDLLLNANLPRTTGYATATRNIGKLSNRGLEISLNTVNLQTRSFNWTSNFNIAFNQNKILALNEGEELLQNTAPTESQFSQPFYIARVGQPAGMMYGYVWEGNYQYSDFDNPAPGVYLLKAEVPANGPTTRASVQPGDIKYKDLNGDGVVNNFDQTIIGRGQPIHTGGFLNNLAYKGFNLSVFLQWSFGNNVYNANRLQLEGNHNNRPDMNQFASYINRWSPTNPTNENYRANGQGVYGYHSSRVMEDGSYLRLKTLQFGYSIPTRYIEKLYLKRLALNISAQNLLTWTKYSGMDPEVSTRSSISSALTPGYDFSSYPHPQTIVFGLNASF